MAVAVVALWSMPMVLAAVLVEAQYHHHLLREAETHHLQTLHKETMVVRALTAFLRALQVAAVVAQEQLVEMHQAQRLAEQVARVQHHLSQGHPLLMQVEVAVLTTLLQVEDPQEAAALVAEVLAVVSVRHLQQMEQSIQVAAEVAHLTV
jgi:hypothetical protein